MVLDNLCSMPCEIRVTPVVRFTPDLMGARDMHISKTLGNEPSRPPYKSLQLAVIASPFLSLLPFKHLGLFCFSCVGSVLENSRSDEPSSYMRGFLD